MTDKDQIQKNKAALLAQMAAPSTSLTDEQIDEITTLQWGVQKVAAMYHAHRAYARAIEAKLKGGA